MQNRKECGFFVTGGLYPHWQPSDNLLKIHSTFIVVFHHEVGCSRTKNELVANCTLICQETAQVYSEKVSRTDQVYVREKRIKHACMPWELW
jgi:hypothetical protein